MFSNIKDMKILNTLNIDYTCCKVFPRSLGNFMQYFEQLFQVPFLAFSYKSGSRGYVLNLITILVNRSFKNTYNISFSTYKCINKSNYTPIIQCKNMYKYYYGF